RRARRRLARGGRRARARGARQSQRGAGALVAERQRARPRAAPEGGRGRSALEHGVGARGGGARGVGGARRRKPRFAERAVIDAALATLKDIDGVYGSFVIDRDGRLKARDLPAVFDEQALGDAGPRIVRLWEVISEDETPEYTL